MGDQAGQRKNRKAKGRAGSCDDMGISVSGDGGSDAIPQKPGITFSSIILVRTPILDAVQVALCAAARWQDPKTIGHALVGMRALAVQLMSGGESHQNLRESQSAALEAPQRCDLAVRMVLQPLVALCRSPPQPPPG